MRQVLRRFLHAPIGIACLVAACNPGQAPAIANKQPTGPQTSGTPTAPIAKGVPHGGVITEVAITEQADAALSFDNLLGIRLWPTLDGTRPPVPVTANAPRQLALAHAGHDLLAVILDDAGAVQVLRLGLDGKVVSRASLPGLYVQAIAIESGVVVRTPDHAVEWYAADGTARGRVMPEPGQQVQGIATRNGRTAVLLANATTDSARTIRWLTLGDTLTWGQSIDVPSSIDGGLFALSPDGKRVAYTTSSSLEVYEIDPFQRVIPGESPIVHRDGDRGIGFIDNDSVVLGDLGQTWLWQPKKPEPVAVAAPQGDPWAVPTTYVTPHPSSMSLPRDTSMLDGFAYGNGVVVMGNGVTLAISTEVATRYLGWKELAAGTLTLVGDQIVMGLSASRFVWLDANLQVKRDVELHESELSPYLYAIPIDEHHVITQTSHDGHYEIAQVDVETKATTAPTTYPESERNDYTPSSQMFAVAEHHKISRFKLDLTANKMTPLEPIKIKGSPTVIRLFDPAKADGMMAAVVAWDSDYAEHQTLTIYSEHGKKRRIHPFDGAILGESADGTLFVYKNGVELNVMKGGNVTRRIPLEGMQQPAISADASRIAALDLKGNVIVLDGTKNDHQVELWRQPMWGAQQVQFTADGKKLFVRAIGGIASYDVATGIRMGLECGWNFGLYDEAIGSSPPGQSLVCEDPMLQ